jgi:hypothetical protein
MRIGIQKPENVPKLDIKYPFNVPTPLPIKFPVTNTDVPGGIIDYELEYQSEDGEYIRLVVGDFEPNREKHKKGVKIFVDKRLYENLFGKYMLDILNSRPARNEIMELARNKAGLEELLQVIETMRAEFLYQRDIEIDDMYG